ncbi:CKLF-like MARVEL transmembrane domain-containing protein 2 [Macrotis lagotis]|uniref:CKLF-like MARVEL transmembrane domain-containing protein 2 n=1 Tax=Macrotis lagotis TaxID=92651 RepID=UPI003D6891DD
METSAPHAAGGGGFSRYRLECGRSSRAYFVTTWSGELKVVAVILLIVSFILLKRTQTAHVFIPMILLIESILYVFFIFANILALPRYLTKLLWPVFDMLNDFFAFIYLAYAGFFSIFNVPATTDKLYWQISIIILSVAFMSLADVVLQSFRIKRMNVNTKLKESIYSPSR